MKDSHWKLQKNHINILKYVHPDKQISSKTNKQQVLYRTVISIIKWQKAQYISNKKLHHIALTSKINSSKAGNWENKLRTRPQTERLISDKYLQGQYESGFQLESCICTTLTTRYDFISDNLETGRVNDNLIWSIFSLDISCALWKFNAENDSLENSIDDIRPIWRYFIFRYFVFVSFETTK